VITPSDLTQFGIVTDPAQYPKTFNEAPMLADDL